MPRQHPGVNALSRKIDNGAWSKARRHHTPYHLSRWSDARILLSMRFASRLGALVLVGLLLAPAALAAPAKARKPGSTKSPAYLERGIASWFRTKKPMAVAHRTLPFGTKLRVTAKSGKSVIVTVVDRGPFIKHRVVDLGSDAFKKLASLGTGLLHVTVTKVN